MSNVTEPDFVRRLADFLQADQASKDVAAYFAERGDDGDLYTGRHFERISGGGDRPDRAHCITADDLVAVQTLSVSVPPETSVQLLEGPLGLTVSRYLRDIPTTVRLLDGEGGQHLADDSPADQCWRLLVSDAAPGVGPTTAGKLLARKRPHLLPVYDDVVRCALGHPSRFWMQLHRALLDGVDLVDVLTDLGRYAPRHVSALRVLDVVVWMAHRGQHSTRCKPGHPTGDAGR